MTFKKIYLVRRIVLIIGLHDLTAGINTQISNGQCGCIRNLIRTYKATDSCGIEASTEQYLCLKAEPGSQAIIQFPISSADNP